MAPTETDTVVRLLHSKGLIPTMQNIGISPCKRDSCRSQAMDCRVE